MLVVGADFIDEDNGAFSMQWSSLKKSSSLCNGESFRISFLKTMGITLLKTLGITLLKTMEPSLRKGEV